MRLSMNDKNEIKQIIAGFTDAGLSGDRQRG